jgi:hypothetical protein
MTKRMVWLSKSTSVLVYVGLALLIPSVLCAQQITQLTIAQAYELAEKNYPLIKQRDLIKKAGDYSVDYDKCNADTIIEKPFNIDDVLEKI